MKKISPPTPELKGPQIELVPFSEKFLSVDYVNWLNDANIMKFSEQRHKSHNIDSCRHYYNEMRKNGHYFWAIVFSEKSAEHIGNIAAYVDSNNKIADLTILIGNSSYQGRGLGLEAWNIALDFLLKDVGLRKVTAGTMSCNEPMLRIMKTSGMILEGRRERQFLVGNESFDLIMAARFSNHHNND